jgi:hypothetical protein
MLDGAKGWLPVQSPRGEDQHQTATKAVGQVYNLVPSPPEFNAAPKVLVIDSELAGVLIDSNASTMLVTTSTNLLADTTPERPNQFLAVKHALVNPVSELLDEEHPANEGTSPAHRCNTRESLTARHKRGWTVLLPRRPPGMAWSDLPAPLAPASPRCHLFHFLLFLEDGSLVSQSKSWDSILLQGTIFVQCTRGLLGCRRCSELLACCFFQSFSDSP